MLNNDTLTTPQTLDKLVSDLNRPDVVLASAKDASPYFADEKAFLETKTAPDDDFHETPDFSCFGINKEGYDSIGGLDTNFYPAYFEDNDYHRRIKIAKKIAECNYANFYYHFGSRTKTLNPEFHAYIESQYLKNQTYYKKKWGGEPGNEQFLIPFNGVEQEDTQKS